MGNTVINWREMEYLENEFIFKVVITSVLILLGLLAWSYCWYCVPLVIPRDFQPLLLGIFVFLGSLSKISWWQGVWYERKINETGVYQRLAIWNNGQRAWSRNMTLGQARVRYVKLQWIKMSSSRSFLTAYEVLDLASNGWYLETDSPDQLVPTWA